MVRKIYNQVYSGLVSMSASGVDAVPHVQVNGADLWTPQGDITIIGAMLRCGINPLPNTKMHEVGGSYVSAELSILARNNEDRAVIVRAWQGYFPLELPTLGEYAIDQFRDAYGYVMFPEGCGIDLDRWHPFYLNVGYRTFFSAGGMECHAEGNIWYVER